MLHNSSPPSSGIQHDFDPAIGTWKAHLTRLIHPLTGSTTWVTYDGTSVVRKVWNGRANLEEFEADGSSGHIEGLTLRLYDPQAQQWNQVWATSNDGTLGQPMVGEFKNDRGEFYDQEPLNGKAIFVRWEQTFPGPDTCHFEQSFSKDGGKTWEVNWVNVYRRAENESEPHALNCAAYRLAVPTIAKPSIAFSTLAFLRNVGFCKGGQPFVIPTLYGRKDDKLYLHGSAASRLLGELEAEIPVSVCVTLVDGLVLARSAFHHSMNYRSVVAFGTARSMTEPELKIEALRIISEHLVPGRWNEVRGA